MSSVAAEETKPVLTLAPLPETKRGYGIHVYAHPKGDRIIYTNGRLVVIRSIENPADAVVFAEHKCKVNVANFSPNGNWVASGDEEGNVIVWSYPHMKVKNTVQVGKSVLDLDWDADSTRIVAVGDGAQNKAKVFNYDSGNNLGEILMHNLSILSVSYRKHRPFRIATASEDLCVNFYEGPPFKYSSSYKGHTRYPNCIRYSPDGEVFVTVGADQKIVVFDGKTGAMQKEIENKEQGHKGSIYAFAFSPCSKKILTASADKTAKIWDLESGAVEKTYTLGNDVGDMQVSAVWTKNTETQKETKLTVSLSGEINVLSDDDENVNKKVDGHQATISAWALDRKNKVIYTTSLTGEITRHTVDLENIKNITQEWMKGKNPQKVVSALALSADGSKLFAFSYDNAVRVHSTSDFVFSSSASDLGGQPVAAAASPVDDVCVCVCKNERVVLVKGDGSVVSTGQLPTEPTAVAFSHDGLNVYVGGKDKKLYVYSLSSSSSLSSSPVKVLSEHDKPITAITSSADGKWMASVDKEASIYIRDIAAGYELKNKNGWRFHQAVVNDVAFAPLTSATPRLATASNDTHILVWNDLKDFLSSARSKISIAHPLGVERVAWWDEKTLISLGADRLVRVWTAPQA